ncbi:hypothetical protein [Priestia megaterium]|uniref:hypothetical protein n=1 Tax=Priestia megaterium TaxID=1404 RepID=UPI003CC640D6
MKIIKFEQDACPNCQRVGAFLSGNGIEHTVVHNTKDPKTNIKYKIGQTAPVTILVDDEDNVIDRVNGFDVPALEAMIAKL